MKIYLYLRYIYCTYLYWVAPYEFWPANIASHLSNIAHLQWSLREQTFDFFRRTFLGGESSGLLQTVLCHIVSDSYWKHYVSSAATIFFSCLDRCRRIKWCLERANLGNAFGRRSNSVERIAHKPSVVSNLHLICHKLLICWYLWHL